MTETVATLTTHSHEVADLALVASRLAEVAADMGAEVIGVTALTYCSPKLELHLRGDEPTVDLLADALELGEPTPQPFRNYERCGTFEGLAVRVYSGRGQR